MDLPQQYLSSTFDAVTSAQIEITWQMASESFVENGEQIVINSSVYRLIGARGVEELKIRLSMFLGDVPVIAFRDPTRNVIRIMSHPDYSSNQSPLLQSLSSNSPWSPPPTTTAEDKPPPPMRAYGKKSKIPRPPNAFILYRQHWHPHYKQYNKSMHNNDISKELGKRWKSEPDHVKEKYKKLAEELKAKHAAQYPDYQYAPRKPGEKKRRMTARKLESWRLAQTAQEVSSFPSPGNSGASGFESSSPNITSGKELTFSGNANALSSDSHEAFGEYGQSSTPIVYQEDDSFSCVLPSFFDDIQAEIQRGCGDYNQSYVDIVQDIGANELPEQHLLQAVPEASAVEKHAEWESLIDWQALNDSVGVTEEMAAYADDLAAEESTGPDSSHKSHDASNMQWPSSISRWR